MQIADFGEKNAEKLPFMNRAHHFSPLYYEEKSNEQNTDHPKHILGWTLQNMQNMAIKMQIKHISVDCAL